MLALRGRGERAILLLDEAQNFDHELLEEIRLLSNLEAGGEKLVQIFLVGQPELESKLSRPELRQLRQRIGVHYRLRPLNPAETEGYIHHRVGVAGGDAQRVFPAEACAEVHAVTNGIPREINQVCAQAMLDAYVDGTPAVTPKHVRSAADETSFQSVLPASETDPRLPPLPSWPAAVPAPPLAPPPEPAPTSAGTEANRWEAWVSSLSQNPHEAGPAPLPPEPPAPALEEVQKIEPPRVPRPAPLPPAPPPPAPVAPAYVKPAIATPPPVAAPAPIASPPPIARPPAAPEAPVAGPGTRYAAESALEPPAGGAAKGEDWRPPLWTPGSPTTGARRGAPPPRRAYDRKRLLEPEPEPSSNLLLKVLITVAVVAVVGIGALLLFRFGPFAKHPKPLPPPSAELMTDTLPAIPYDSTSALAGVDSLATDSSLAAVPSATADEPPAAVQMKAPAPPVAQKPTALAPKPVTTEPLKTVPAARPVTPAAAAPATTQEFGIVVGTYLDRARAQSEVVRIGGASGLTGRLAEVQSGGATMYAVIIGAFPDRATAERRASELVSRGTVDEARIISRTVNARP
jgi:hypothetical protein